MTGSSITLTPPASATWQSPSRRFLHARCTATSEADDAVSTVSEGPENPKKCDNRPEAE